jgi:hypothetical protein
MRAARSWPLAGSAGFRRPSPGLAPQQAVDQWRRERGANCDTLIGRLRSLEAADPPLRLDSHPVTRRLAEEPSPVDDAAYEHREDLIDALLCAWTASLWARRGLERCQVLGLPAGPADRPVATIIVPARPEQRQLSGPPIPSVSSVPALEVDWLPGWWRGGIEQPDPVAPR